MLKRLFLVLCCFLLISCSVTREKAESDPELKPIVEALQKNEVRISLTSMVPSIAVPFMDISGASYAIRIMGDIAKASLPRIDETSADDSGTLSRLGVNVAEYSCQKIATERTRVIYVLRDLYGNLGYEIKVICSYSGSAIVIIESHHAASTVRKYNAEIQQMF